MIVASTSERERRTKDSETTNNIPNERTNRREIELVSEVKQIFNENWKQIHFKWNCSSFLCVFCVYCFAVLVIDHFTSKLNFPTGRLREREREQYTYSTQTICVCLFSHTNTHTENSMWVVSCCAFQFLFNIFTKQSQFISNEYQNKNSGCFFYFFPFFLAPVALCVLFPIHSS